MYSDVYKFCKGCLIYVAYNGGGRRTKPPLSQYLYVVL